MKTIQYINYKNFFLLVAVLLLVACERDLSDEAEFATFSTTNEVFTDAPVGLGSDFYFPFSGSKPTAFSVDDTQGYESNASMRIDVPNANDTEGNYAGAIFRIEGSGRNLTQYDALTFWAKASQGVSIDEIGFGQDFGENKFQVSRSNVTLGTNWAKYVIPIPDPSKLIQERGMLWYATGTQNTGGAGYTFWLDEVKFERLGTIAQPRPSILGGATVSQDAFIDIPLQINGLTQTFNTANGNVTVTAAPSYFRFNSSDIGVAYASELGEVTVVGKGEATITATVANVAAAGSLVLNVTGTFDFAPTPPQRNAEDVLSIFSDAYTNVPVDYYNGFFFNGFQTTEGGAPPLDINGDQIIHYTKLNFVGIGTFQDVPPVNITNMTHLHVDIKVNESIDPGDFIRLQLLNSVGNNETSGSVTIDAASLSANQWVSFDIPLADFNLANRSQIGLLFFITDATIADIFVDNIYYYR